MGRGVKQQEQKETNVTKFISMVKKYTEMNQIDATILGKFVDSLSPVICRLSSPRKGGS